MLSIPAAAWADEPLAIPSRHEPVGLEVRPPVRASEAQVPAPDDDTSLSVGTPWRGALRGGRLLRESEHVRYLPRHARTGNFWGIDSLVELLERSAAAVGSRWPGSRMTVGELSARHGGDLRGHRSHHSGRDADIGFYVRHDDGGYGRLAQFVGFGRRAPLDSGVTVRFDDARNWALVEALMRDPRARVQYIFASNDIRARLLSYGRQRGASDHFLSSIAAVMLEPARAETHDDHFHVRIYCPPSQRGRCQDAEPYWPWFDGEPPGGTYTALPSIRWRPAGRHPPVIGERAPLEATLHPIP